MRAIGFTETGPIDRPDALIERKIADPVPGDHDLLVRVEAVSVNPVDTKIRGSSTTSRTEYTTTPSRWSATTRWEPSSRSARTRRCSSRGTGSWYAGSVLRAGTNSELHVVDERIVGPAPRTLSAAAAAALPLTAITAWEMLFDRLDVRRPVPRDNRTILVIGGAGGVGSIAIQLARQVARMTVIATASRPESRSWALAAGANHVIDHAHAMSAQLRELGVGAPGFVFSTTQTSAHFADIMELIAPQGRLGVISGIGDATRPDPLSGKSITLCYELMLTRASFQTPDMIEQHNLLAEVSRLVDAGVLKSTMN